MVRTHTPKERAHAIEALASSLSELRDSVGRPSFRAMAGRSGAISHTTLHEAAQGNRLPSWDTTVEFVKTCGADPADYRVPWERADRVVVASRPAPGTAAVPRGSDDTPTMPDPGDPRSRPTPRRVYLAVGVAILAIVGAVVGVRINQSSPTQGNQIQPFDTRALASTDCPISQTNPPSAPPEHDGDRAMFVTDVTLPDCTRVKPGASVVKTWRFKNAGTVAWKGYTLHRIDPQSRDTCQTVPEVPIPGTAPGGFVDVSTRVTMPDTASFCFVRFKMRDASDTDAFPGGRPVNFQVVVE